MPYNLILQAVNAPDWIGKTVLIRLTSGAEIQGTVASVHYPRIDLVNNSLQDCILTLSVDPPGPTPPANRSFFVRHIMEITNVTP